MTFKATAIIGGSSIVGGLLGRSIKPKAPKAPKPANIPALIRQANQQAEDNIRRSIELESRYDPATARLRGITDQSLIDDMSLNTTGRDEVLRDLMSTAQSQDPLLTAAYNATAEDLSRGGTLDTEMHNDVMRGALARTGRAGIGGSAAEGGLVARDLGLTSEALRQQRIQAAAQMGDGLRQHRLAGLSTALQASQSTQAQDVARRQGIAAMVQARERPIAGLDPASIADITVGNANMANQAAMNRAQISASNRQGMFNMIGSLAGTAASLYTPKTPTPTPLPLRDQIGPGGFKF